MSGVLSNIDEVFILNIPERKDRLRQMQQQLAPLNIGYRIIPAIKNENGAKGLMQTLKYLFDVITETKLNNTLVFEDDALLCDDFVNVLNEYMKVLPDDFDMFHLGVNLLLPPEKVNDKILRITGAYAAHAVVYSKRGIEKILSFLDEESNLAYDQQLYNNIQKEGHCYCSNPILVKQRPSVSDIFKYNPEVHRGIEKYYNVKENTIDWQVLMDERFLMMTKNL